MAIFHFSYSHIGRSKGKSAVQASAQITGTSLVETSRGVKANYKKETIYTILSKTLSPIDAPLEFHELNVWDKIDSFEDIYASKRYPKNLDAREKYKASARTALAFLVALPKDLPQEACQKLIEEFANDRYISQRLIVTYAIHLVEENPYAWLQVSRRSVDDKGILSWAKNRHMCLRNELLVTRKVWADLTNSYLSDAGSDARVTEKSFEDLGINLLPTKHLGRVASKMKKEGIPSRIALENVEILLKNQKIREEKKQPVGANTISTLKRFKTFISSNLR